MASVSSVLSARTAVEDRAQAPPIDEAAFRISYRRTAPGLRSYNRRICGDIALPDDIFQETFYHFLGARPPTEAVLGSASLGARLFLRDVGAVDEATINSYIESQQWDEDEEGFKITASTKP